MNKLKEFIKRRKKLLIGITIVIVIIIGWICCKANTKAEEGFYINYGTYNYVAVCNNVYTEDDLVWVDLGCFGEVVNQDSVDYTIQDFTGDYNINIPNADERDYLDLIDKSVLVQIDRQSYICSKIVLYDDYISESLSNYYQQGYESGVNANASESYSSGYNAGLNQATSNYNDTYNELVDTYNSVIAQKNETIDQLTSALQEENKGFQFATFSQLLGAIVTYPVRFFKEGLDVEVFGVNVGAFIVAFILISISVGVVGIILHGRRNNQ